MGADGLAVPTELFEEGVSVGVGLDTIGDADDRELGGAGHVSIVNPALGFVKSHITNNRGGPGSNG